MFNQYFLKPHENKNGEISLRVAGWLAEFVLHVLHTAVNIVKTESFF
jgi:hypothetical protein